MLPTFTGAKSLALADWIAVSPVPKYFVFSSLKMT